MEKKAEFRGIVRVAGKDVKGELSLAKALNQIKGVGVNIADSVATIAARELKIDKREMVGNLDDDQIEIIEKVLKDPSAYGIPEWALNRRKDSTGKNNHLIGSDLDFAVRQNIEAEKSVKSYKGVRHMFGLPVRGQRTKTMGRKGMTLGVVKKKMMPAKAGEDKKGKRGKK